MNYWWRVMMVGWCVVVVVNLGCASKKSIPITTLDPPPNANSEVQAMFMEGSRLFKEGRWEAARQQFQSAVQQQPNLAEAHYNLALSMDRMGDRAGAKPHFIEAANLAPGHKVIWNSPPLRRYGNVPDRPAAAAVTPTLPGGLGGGGRPGGGGGF